MIPVVSFDSELWVLKGHETFTKIPKLDRKKMPKILRLNYSAYVPLEWLSIDRLIQVKKLMFLRTITTRDDDAECKKILVETSKRYLEYVGKCSQDVTNSPIFEYV